MAEIMHTSCKTTSEDVLAAEAVHVLEENKITSLLVADDKERLVGALNIPTWAKAMELVMDPAFVGAAFALGRDYFFPRTSFSSTYVVN